MLSDSIHESSKSYLGNRRELVNFLSSQGYKSPHYIANDIEDNKISSYYLVNIAVMLTNRASRSYDEKINNWAGLFWWTYTQIRLHTLFCNYPGPNFENGFFKTLHNENCGFLGPQVYANITGQGVYDIYNLSLIHI